jgi:hypothetical protein
MHKNATKCNETLSKWCKNKHGASKIIDTFETYQSSKSSKLPSFELLRRRGMSLLMGPYARKIGFGLLKITYLPLDLFYAKLFLLRSS